MIIAYMTDKISPFSALKNNFQQAVKGGSASGKPNRYNGIPTSKKIGVLYLFQIIHHALFRW